MFAIGYTPGKVYTKTQQTQGKCPTVGTAFVDNQGREFVMVKIGTAQLTNGMAVVINASTYTTIQGTAAVGGIPNLGPSGIVYASVTASTSALVWMQVFGLCKIAIFDNSSSALPGAACKFGANGAINSASVTTASAYIAGINCAATNSVVSSPVGVVFLNYPTNIGG